MRSIPKIAALMATALAAPVAPLVLSATPSFAGSGCTTTIANQSLENVYVPAGQTCTLTNDSVSGNVDDYGTLNLDSPSIGGNLTVEPGAGFNSGGAFSVTRNFVIDAQAGGGFGAATIGGNFILENMGSGFGFFSNTVGGNLIASNNGSITLGNNTVAKNINCTGNNPAPTNGGSPNTVGGKETGQCAALN